MDILRSYWDRVSTEAATKSRIFKEWQEGLDPRFKVKAIVFQSVDLKGNGPMEKREVRFIKFEAEVEDEKGNRIPGIVFMRGGAVAILVVLRCEGEKHTVLVTQPRFASGSFEFPEIPAGVIDHDGSFAGNATRELEEEVGIKIHENELADMTESVYGDKWRGVFSTPGVSDEFIRVFLYEKEISRKELEDLQGKCTGLAEEGERIRLKVIPLENLVRETPDAKSLSAYAFYAFLENQGIRALRKLLSNKIGLREE